MTAWTKIRLENATMRKILSLLTEEELEELKERKRKRMGKELNASVLDTLDRLIAARRIAQNLKPEETQP